MEGRKGLHGKMELVSVGCIWYFIALILEDKPTKNVLPSHSSKNLSLHVYSILRKKMIFGSGLIILSPIPSFPFSLSS
jgi:hypothetical protein